MHEESDNITHTIETLKVCDNPPNDNNIDKILNEGICLNKPLNETTIEINPNVICKNFVCDVENNMCEGKDVSKVVNNNDEDMSQPEANVSENGVDENVSEEVTEDAKEINEGEEEVNQGYV